MGYSKNSTLGTKCDVFIYSHYSYLFVDLAHCACFSVNVYDMKNNNKNLLNWTEELKVMELNGKWGGAVD